MELAWLSLAGFRSYRDLNWRPEEGVNLLVGRNGAGKTNLLEAVGYLAALRSFRHAPEEALVHHDAESAVVRGEVRREAGKALIEVEVRRRGGRRALLNRQALARSADLLGYVRVVAFLPEDLDLVKRGPAHRRDFLDQLAVQLWPGSHLDQSEFERALRQRNAYLRQGADDPTTLAVWDERLAQAGGKVMSRRARAAAALGERLPEAHRLIAGGEAGVRFVYLSEWGGGLEPSVPPSEHAARLGEALARCRRVDRERRVTTAGPQRDEPTLLLGEHDARHHASQGEQRTLALSLRLASHRAIADLIGADPLLLLDDVYSELDPVRSEALTAALPKTQTLVTTAHPEDVPLDGRIWMVEDGTLR